MIQQLRWWLPLRQLVVVADSMYAALALLGCSASMIEPVAIVTCLRLDAALYDPVPVRKPRTNGRPRKKGARQPTLAQRLVEPTTVWQSITGLGMAGLHVRSNWQAKRLSGITLDCHRSRSVGCAWRDPQGQFDPQALLCTDQQASAQATLEWFVMLWQMEVTIHSVRAETGAWRPSANGPTWPFCAPLLHCSVSFLWWLSLLISCSRVSLCLFVKPLGIPKHFLRFPIRPDR